jgi:small subunit ribosomal protein S10
MAQSIRIRLKAFDHDHRPVDSQDRRDGHLHQRHGSWPYPPIDKHRYTVIRGPHIDKDSRSTRDACPQASDDIIDPNAKTIDGLQRTELPAGVDIEIKIQSS